jgi:hypothetical protein
MSDPIEKLDKAIARAEFLMMLGGDAVMLLARCSEEADMPPELCEDVNTLLLRVANLKGSQ